MDKLRECERLYALRGDSKSALLLARRCWIKYYAGGDQAYLVKALGAASEACAKDALDVPPLLMKVFFLEEMGYTRDAKELLGGLSRHKGWLKAKEPLYFAALNALDALVELRRNRDRAATRRYDALEAADAPGQKAELDAITGAVNVRFRSYGEAYEYLSAAHGAGNRGAFLFMALYEIYGDDEPEGARAGLLSPFLDWGLSHGLDLSAIIVKWRSFIFAIVKNDFALAARIYAVYPSDWLLRAICRLLSESGDKSSRAFYYYKEAETKQLYFQGLELRLVEAACGGGLTDISRFTLSKFLRSGEGEERLLAFAYNVMLSDGKFSDLLSEHAEAVLAFAERQLKREGREDAYPELYRFLLEQGRGLDAALIDRAEALVWGMLFEYEAALPNPKIEKVWVKEPGLREGRFFEASAGKIKIRAGSDNFTAAFFGAQMRPALDTEAVFKKNVNVAGARLYGYFFSKGYYCPELAAALADVYAESPDESRAPLLERAAQDADLSPELRNRCRAALGAYFAGKDAAEAAKWYGALDESLLTGAFVEKTLLTFTGAGMFERALGLIVRKAEYVSDRTLFAAVKKIAAAGGFERQLAPVSYELLLKNFYDPSLLALVISHYNGSHDDWLALSAQLAAIGAEDYGVDSRVLENAVFIKRRDAKTQSVFARVAAKAPESDIVADFCGYMAYEILTNGMKPEYDAIEAMEALFFACGDHAAAYALTAAYIGHGIESKNSEAVIKQSAAFCEEDGILFPVFQLIKDKSRITPYMERNAAFCHVSAAGGAAELYYRFDGEERFTKKPMKRWRFGMWFAALPLFYAETAEYYVKETAGGGSAQTARSTVSNGRMPRLDDERDEYALLNGAALCERMFQYARAEEKIGKCLAKQPDVVARLL